MYNETDITPTTFFSEPIEPEECATHVHTVTLDLCDVDETGERATMPAHLINAPNKKKYI